MSDREVNINFNTRANTSGAKEMEDSLKKVNEAAEGNPMLKGKAESDARRRASEELTDQLSKEAEATVSVKEAVKEVSEVLPDLTEADVAAEAMERLGDASAEAGGKGSILGGIFGSAAMRLNLLAAAAWAAKEAVMGWIEGTRMLNEISEIGVDNIEQIDKAARSAAAAEEAAAQAAENLADARKRGDEIVRQSTAGMGSFNEAIQRTIDKENELRKLRDEITGKKLDADLAEAEGDPEKQEQIREEARKAAQKTERDRINADLARQREIKEKAAREFTSLGEMENAAKGQAESFGASSEGQEAQAEKLRQKAAEAEMQRQFSIQRKQAAEKGLESFWIPTYQKNIFRDQVADETEHAAAFEKQREDLKRRAALMEAAAEQNKILADKQKQAAENYGREKATVNETYGQASQEEERLAGVVVPHIREKQAEENRAAEARRKTAERDREEKRAADEQKLKEKAKREREKRQREIDRDAKGIPGRVGAALKGAEDSGLTRNVQEAAAALKDGATGGELSELGAALKLLADAAKSAPRQQKAEIAALRKTIEDLAQQIKNNR